MSLRHQRNKAEDEDASQLKLGPEFKDESCFSISEIYHLLTLQQERNGGKQQDNPVYQKTFDYVKTFARFSGGDVIQEVRETLLKSEGLDLKQFEAAQLGNLCPAEAEEAKSLIPSLASKDDEKLQTLLNTVAGLRRFQA